MKITASLGAAALAISPLAALADGTFVQIEQANTTAGAVLAVTRDRLNYGGIVSHWDGGYSVVGSVLYGFDTPFGANFKVGPALGAVFKDGEEDSYELGVRASLDRWMATDWGSFYYLAEVNSIDNSWFLLASSGWGETGFGTELSTGGSDSYSDTTLAVTKHYDGPVSFRAGYRFESEEFFIGFSVNTF
ncbi:hypothetical protein CEW88_09745 [Alloyangia pacifica]|uniref:Outer membrane protein beta-barrel domain-containing protein n=1 Tax=Alloyangia pacifica TaxID=311180 RepID=A0A2U8HDR4_9RHOB|nr:hypothetical protein [Alloyangia pacifica]AWI83934.1 hypothetical protein CEW88_09745 [Alloyangia pacifica]